MSASITVLNREDVARIMNDESLGTFEERSDMVTTLCPSLWCATYLNDPMNRDSPFNVRDYQDDMLCSKAENIAARCGRQIGKTVSLCARMLWAVINFPGHEILVITPLKSHIKNIFNTMDDLVYSSDYAKAQVKTPYSEKTREMTFHNGSVIRAFPANTHPAQVRGQHADWIYVDEGDYLNKDAVSAVQGVRQGRKGIGLWVSSTPTGARDWFFNNCTQWQERMEQMDEKFAHFHFTSRVNPDWDDEMEELQRIAYLGRDNDFIHEVEADWGELDSAVFKPLLIEKSLDLGITDDEENGFYDKKKRQYFYKLGSQQPIENGTYFMGVDWNGAAIGTHIVVVQLYGDKLKVVDKKVISVEEYQQTKSVELIIEVFKRWKPEWLYVDEGFGTMQIEHLRMYGMKFPGSGLATKLIPVDFKKNIEIKDPFTGKPSKKPIKTFMLDNAARLMELGRIVLPKEEDVKDGLVNQIRHFKVKKVSDFGHVKYDGVDHTLVAWLMAIFAYAEKYTDMLDMNSSYILSKHKKVGSKIISSRVNPLIAGNIASGSRSIDAIKNSQLFSVPNDSNKRLDSLDHKAQSAGFKIDTTGRNKPVSFQSKPQGPYSGAGKPKSRAIRPGKFGRR